jgi:MFS family permease
MPESAEAERRDRSLRRNVPVLGTTALLNDTASEMAYWVLPYFLTQLGAGPAALGLIEGLAEAAVNVFRLISGYLTDRLPRRKPLVVAGYLIANAVKPLLALTQSWWQVLLLRVSDRSAKGLRGSPRDVMIAESAAKGALGAAYGLRQAMDSAGAILGPAMAFLIMTGLHEDVRAVFWLAGIPGAVAIVVAALLIRETGNARGRKDAQHQSAPEPPAREARRSEANERTFEKEKAGPPTGGGGVHFRGGFLLLLAAAALFGLANSTDMLLILRAENLGIAARYAPLLGIVFNVVFTSLSYPFGHLSDRVARKYVVGSGWFFFAAVYFGFGIARSSAWVWPLFAIYGIYYALSEGVLRALVADLVSAAERGRAFGWVSFVGGVMALVSSVLAGWLWHRYGAPVPFKLSALLATMAAAMVLALPRSRSSAAAAH